MDLFLLLYTGSHGRYLFQKHHVSYSGPGSVVRMATGYGVDGLGIEFRWGRNFPHLSGPALGPTQPPVQWVTGLSMELSAVEA